VVADVVVVAGAVDEETAARSEAGVDGVWSHGPSLRGVAMDIDVLGVSPSQCTLAETRGAHIEE
jgi:hypothetical protein